MDEPDGERAAMMVNYKAPHAKVMSTEMYEEKMVLMYSAGCVSSQTYTIFFSPNLICSNKDKLSQRLIKM